MESSFKEVLQKYEWDTVKQRIYSTTKSDVQKSLAKTSKNLEDFLVLISPVAKEFLEPMVKEAQRITQRRFGKNILMYAPLYLSNECQNICTYCGFSLDNNIRRKTLSDKQILQEAMVLKQMGFEHILLVSGEANAKVGLSYFLNAIELLRQHFAHISIEVQPLLQEEYIQVKQKGVHSVLVYQETYHQEVYKKYHPKGKKSNFLFRLDTPDRLGRAKMHKIGLGVLLGLEDWRVDSFFTGLHIDYLQKKYWQSKYSVSFPRLRPAQGSLEPNFIMSDSDLLQLISAYRLCNEDLEISISTRENEKFRDHIISLGATSMSAASKTNPGGYSSDKDSLEQFETSDQRSLEEIKRQIKASGYMALMKDWEMIYSTKEVYGR